MKRKGADATWPRCSRCGRYLKIEESDYGPVKSCTRQSCADADQAAYESYHERMAEGGYDRR